MGRRLTYRLSTYQETLAFGQKMAELLPSNAVLALSGDLGAGKTSFVQGLALGLGIEDPIQSPTFVLLNNYNEQLYHFDLYRLKTPSDFTSLGFDEYFQKGGICAIEWPDRIKNLLPPETIYIDFQYDGESRIAEVT